MNNGIDIQEIVRGLPKRRRGKGCIVLTEEYFEQKRWAEKLAGLTESRHIDLLDYFDSDPELAGRIATFTIDGIFKFFSTFPDSKVLVVTGLEFLRAIWGSQSTALESIAHKIENWEATPALLLVTQFDAGLARMKFTRHPGQVFLVKQKETYALP